VSSWGRLHVVVSVLNKAAVDGVGQAPLEISQLFQWLLPAARCPGSRRDRGVVADLGDGHDVQTIVELAVPGAGEPVADDVTGEHLDRVTRRPPVEMLTEEAPRLHQLPAAAFTAAFGVTRTVGENTPMISSEVGQYSVSPQLADLHHLDVRGLAAARTDRK
jgi:hypothetical protein